MENKKQQTISPKNKKTIIAVVITIIILIICLICSMIIALNFFAADVFQTQAYQTCLSAPNSQGCIACQNGGLSSDWVYAKDEKNNPGKKDGDPTQQCTFCEYEYYQKAKDENYKLDLECMDPVKLDIMQ